MAQFDLVYIPFFLILSLFLRRVDAEVAGASLCAG